MSETLTLTHGCSLSNLPLFVASAAGLFADEGLDVHAPPYSHMSSTAQALATGAADLGTAAFTQPLIDASSALPPVLVAGSGLMGIAVLAQPGTGYIGDLLGRPIGTFRGDPLEVLLHDLLAAGGLSEADVEIQFLDHIEDAIYAFRDGHLAGITLAEPHATRLRHSGAVELSDGTELWGTPFPDTVLVSSRKLLTERPEVVAAAIRALLRAEGLIADDHVAAVRSAAEHFPGYDIGLLVEASLRQPPCVDLRRLVPVVHARWGSLGELGLVTPGSPHPTSAIDLTLLERELVARPPHPTRPAHEGATP